jgi:hypothetical protein
MATAKSKNKTDGLEAAGQVLGDVIEVGPEILQAGREVGEFGAAVKFALSSESEGGKKISKAEARRILKEAGEAGGACLRLVRLLLPLAV